MAWKKELDTLETAKHWQASVDFFDRTIPLYPNDVELHVRAIYLLLNLLLEEDYAAHELSHDDLAVRLKKYFDDSYARLSENAEYLFFIGYFVSLAEWYFGQSDLSLSYEMLKKAAYLEPENSLYVWAYRFVSGDHSAKAVCQQIKSEATFSWLESKGPPGQYLTEIIKTSCE